MLQRWVILNVVVDQQLMTEFLFVPLLRLSSFLEGRNIDVFLFSAFRLHSRELKRLKQFFQPLPTLPLPLSELKKTKSLENL